MLRPFNRRNDVDICDTNCSLLSLGEAVRRWSEDGQFLMTEVNSSDSYEHDNVDIPSDSMVSQRVSKIEAFLAGQGFVKEIQAGKSEPSPEPIPEPTSEPTPSE